MDLIVRQVFLWTVCALLVSWVHSSTAPISKVQRRDKRDNNPSWKYTQFQINALKAELMNFDHTFCRGNPFEGIQCVEENLCASWGEICDGRQKCALDAKLDCLNQTIISFGTIDDRVCDGDENERWCSWKMQAPQRCGKDYVIKAEKARSRSVKIYSPNWPKRYTNDRFCYWTVTGAEGHKLSVRIKKFKTERNFDYLSIGNGDRYDDENSMIVFKHSGLQKPKQKKFNTKSNKVWISFRSDDWENERGFYIEVSDTLRYDAGVVGKNPFKNNKRNKDCGGEISLEANEEYQLTSPGYPNTYIDNQECFWIIGMPPGRRMELQFDLFDLEEPLDYLSLGNGNDSRVKPLLYKHSGRAPPANIISEGHLLWVKFVTSLAIARNGFNIKIKDVPYSDCGDEQVNIKTLAPGSSISVSTPNYPLEYDNNLNCVYRFQTNEGHRLRFRIVDFSSELGYDKLSFGNGFDVNERTAVVWSHSGSNKPSQSEFVSEGQSVWVSFISDIVGTSTGLLADVQALESR